MHIEWKVLEDDIVKVYLVTKNEIERIGLRSEKRDAISIELPWILRFLLRYYGITAKCEQIENK